jgi:endoglucanase
VGRRIVTLVVTLLTCAAVTWTSEEARAATPGWSTSGPMILDPNGNEYILTGVNWYGFETPNIVFYGLSSQDYRPLVNQVKQDGYNTIRIAFANQVWESDPRPNKKVVKACADCRNKRARDILALVVNYAGSIGLHVVMDNHRSTEGGSSQESGLWYASRYTEQAWIRDWLSVQAWAHGIPQTLGAADTVTVNPVASDGFPTVIGYDLRNEPHTPNGASYLSGATWGTGDGIDPAVNPNPNPFAPTCVATSTCHDWRLAAERAADSLLGDASSKGWEYPLVFVEGIGTYPAPGGTAASGPYDTYWWGGDLLGVNGNSSNPGAPVVLNAGGTSTTLGPPVEDHLVYSPHDYGPSLAPLRWFNSSTCYKSGCSSSSLADVWLSHWAVLNQSGGVAPVWPGHPEGYPWSNTGHTGYQQTPLYLGEFGTRKTDADLFSTGAGSQGQWFTDLMGLILSSYPDTRTDANNPGYTVSSISWAYWAFNAGDPYGLLNYDWTGFANQKKEFSFLCFAQRAPYAIPQGTGAGACGSTGPIPDPQ